MARGEGEAEGGITGVSEGAVSGADSKVWMKRNITNATYATKADIGVTLAQFKEAECRRHIVTNVKPADIENICSATKILLRKIMLLFVKNVRLESTPRTGLPNGILDPVDNQVYRSKTLRRGFCDACFLAEMVNIVSLSLGVFRFDTSA